MKYVHDPTENTRFCHAERSEASPIIYDETLRFVQGDITTL